MQPGKPLHLPSHITLELPRVSLPPSFSGVQSDFMNIPEVTRNFRSATLILCDFSLALRFLRDLQEFQYAKYFSLEEGEGEKKRREEWDGKREGEGEKRVALASRLFQTQKGFSTISGEYTNCKWGKIWPDIKTQKCNNNNNDNNKNKQHMFELLLRENKDSVFRHLSTTLEHWPVSAVFCFLKKLNPSAFSTCYQWLNKKQQKAKTKGKDRCHPLFFIKEKN